MLIGFLTNYYFQKVTMIFWGTNSIGISLFGGIFGAKIGWLFFLIISAGYVMTLVFASIDNHYSKRAKLSFQGTIGFTVLLFLALVIWLLFDKGYPIGTTRELGATIKGGFGFAVYWLFIHLVSSGLVALLYDGYKGPGEPSALKWLKGLVRSESVKPANKGDKYTDLTKAKELFDQGILTEEEYLEIGRAHV